jgi:hypothetical protein
MARSFETARSYIWNSFFPGRGRLEEVDPAACAGSSPRSKGKGPLDPEGERPGQTGALPRTGATHANARPMAEQGRPIWELDFSLQDLNVSALGH